MEEYFINFHTVETSEGVAIDAVKVTLSMVRVTDKNKSFNIALCEHPLYKELQEYVRANPR